MDFDAVILAGGLGSRLGGESKADLRIGGRSLLEIAVSAASGARRVVVVGEPMGGLPVDTRFTREAPAFGGPAAALGAGLRELASADAAGPCAWTLALACDMPKIALAVDALRASASVVDSGAGGVLDGVLAVDQTGRRQYLAALYRTAPLSRSIDGIRSLDGVSLKSVVSALKLAEVLVPAGSTADIDTWADAERHGATTRNSAHPHPAERGTR